MRVFKNKKIINIYFDKTEKRWKEGKDPLTTEGFLSFINKKVLTKASA